MNIESKADILIVTQSLPYPLDIGGKIRIYTLCKYLREKYNFILLSLINNQEEIKYVPELKKIFSQVHCILERSDSPDILYPRDFLGSYSKELVQKFKEIKRNNKIKVIDIESDELLYLAGYIDDIPLVFTEHDASILSLKYSYYPPRSLFTSRCLDHLKKIRYLKKFYSRAAKIITVSGQDKEIIASFVSDKEVSCVPSGVDIDYFHFQSERRILNRLVFVGWYLHYPNEDAILYFSKKIFPLLRNKIKDIELLIVGRDPTYRVMQLSRQRGIKLIGRVETVKDYLNDSTVFINPSRLGFGMKSKILEAMASGIPVISTLKGSRGLGARHNIEILLADKRADFINQTLRLLTDYQLRGQIAVNARKLMEQNYDWCKIAANLDALYKSTINPTI